MKFEIGKKMNNQISRKTVDKVPAYKFEISIVCKTIMIDHKLTYTSTSVIL